MSDIIEIYGTTVRLPELPPYEDIINHDAPRAEQKWLKRELPSFFDKVEYNKKGDLILTAKQESYAAEEVRKCKNGVWYKIGGSYRYLTGKYYFFLQYYILEDGNAPEFREADRLYFLFYDHWFNIDWCLGNIRIKKRRQGASSQSCSNILYEAIFYKNSNCGLLSKTKEDSKDTFTQMITAAYRQLPAFLKPKQVNKEDSVTELVFAHKAQTLKEGVSDAQKIEEGHNSRINYKAPVLNAYDRGRMSYVLGDEFGKLPQDVPASRLLAIISKTLVRGVKRVGWIDMPSTVNEMTAGGGAEYKKIWDYADQFKKTPTVNRIVRFFQPAYESYDGFIDEFGDSVIDEPTEEQYAYLVDKWVRRNEYGELISELSEDDIRLGAKVYVLNKLRDGKTGTDLEEEIRMNPCTEDEAFLYAGVGCEYNAVNFNNQIKWIEDHPEQCYWRQSRLVIKRDKIKSIVHGKPDRDTLSVGYMDDTKGGWFILEEPSRPNHFSDRNGYLEPLNKIAYQIGVDTTQDRIAVAGSNPAIVVFKKSCIINGEETGMYPVALWISPTRLDIHFDDEVRKACLWYGCEANYEIDRRTDFYRFFCKENCQKFLTWTPKVMMNPLKPNKMPEYGSRSGDPFQLAQMLQISKLYADGDDNEVYNGHIHRVKHIELIKQGLHYNHLDRTKSDLWVALQMSLVPVFGEMQIPQKIQSGAPRLLLPQYKIKMVS